MKRVSIFPCLVVALVAATLAGPANAQKKKNNNAEPMAMSTSTKADVTPPPGMVLVPAGKVMLGNTKDQLKAVAERYKLDLRDRDELVNGELIGKRDQAIPLDAFYMDEHELSNQAYAAFTKATGYKTPEFWEGEEPKDELLNLPVVSVRYIDAAAYAKWAGKRIPTEAEWERGARGDDTRIFPWGDDWDERQALFNAGQKKKARGAKVNNNCNSIEAQQGSPVEVGKYKDGASPFGVYDMAGNVWEWTSSWIGLHPGLPPNQDSPVNGAYGRVVKGGSFMNSKKVQRSTVRMFFDPGESQDALGFRCVKSLKGGLDRLYYTVEDLLPALPPASKFQVGRDGYAEEEAEYHPVHGFSLGAKSVGICPVELIPATDVKGLQRMARKNTLDKEVLLGVFHTDYAVTDLGLEPGDYSVYYQAGDAQKLKNWVKEQEAKREAEKKEKEAKAEEEAKRGKADDKKGDPFGGSARLEAQEDEAEEEEEEMPPFSAEDRLTIKDSDGYLVAEIKQPVVNGVNATEACSFKQGPNGETILVFAIRPQFRSKTLLVEAPVKIAR